MSDKDDEFFDLEEGFFEENFDVHVWIIIMDVAVVSCDYD